MKFNAVGVAGAVVQLAALWVLREAMGLDLALATALAVESALLHNFIWHERWTWRTRGEAGVWARLGKFHLGNGAVSMASNVILMQIFVEGLGISLLLANLGSIGITAVANFAIGERFVFTKAGDSRTNL